MSVQCSICNTENRDAAKFCKGCGRKLESAWAKTEVAPLYGAAAVAGAAADVAAMVPAALPQSPVARMAQARPQAASVEPLAAATGPSPRSRRNIVLAVAAVSLLVVVGAWYGLSNRGKPAVNPANPAPAAEAAMAPPQAVAPLPPPVAAPTITPSDSAPASTVTAAPIEAPRSEMATPSITKPTPARKKAAPKPPAPVAVQEAPAPPPPATEPAPVVVRNPQTVCAGRNFIAAAQCMASQCALSEFKATPQCEAVRRQQRIEEEKRNPTLAY